MFIRNLLLCESPVDSFYCVSAGAWQRLDHDWIKKRLPNDRSVTFENITNSIGVLVIAGPKSRELLQKVSIDDFSNEAFPWLSGRKVKIGLAETLALRMNFVGELGWELGLETTFSSPAQEPKSINLHLSEQNGLKTFLLVKSIFLLQLGHSFISDFQIKVMCFSYLLLKRC